MIDKEKLLEIKNNLEERAEICSKAVEDAWREKEEEIKRYDRMIEKTLFDRKKNEVLLTLVNNELQAMEEVGKVKFEPWRKRIIDKAFEELHQEHEPWSEQVKAGDKAWNEKQSKNSLNDSVEAMMIEDGLTDHMVRDKEYTFEEFEDEVLDRYSEVSERVKATDKDKPKDRSFASFLQKYWKLSPQFASLLEKQWEKDQLRDNKDEGVTDEVSVETYNNVIEKMLNPKQISNEDESKEKLSNENPKNVTKSLEKPNDDTVTAGDKRVRQKNKSYDAVTAKIKEGRALDQSEVNSLFKPCYEIECAIVDILKKHKTLKLKDIVYFVEQKDLDFESKHIYGFVQSVLNRSERFEKVSYGNWRLKKEEGEIEATKPDSNDEEDSIAESTVLSVVRPKWNGVISYVDKLGVVNKIEQK